MLWCALKFAISVEINTFIVKTVCDTRGKNPSLLAFSLNHIIRCICYKILFTESKYLLSNWS